MHPTDGDPLVALAGELGRIGQRLDGIGAELLALRAGLAAPDHAVRTAAPGPPPAGPPSPGPAEVGGLATPSPGAPGPLAWGPPAGAGRQWLAPAPALPPPGAPPVPAGAGGAAVPPWGAPWPAGASLAAAGAPRALPAGPGVPPPGTPWAPAAGPGGGPAAPPSGWSPPPWAAGPPPPPAPRRPRSLDGARLLAWAGAGVTLVGVVLLLALAASRGWLTPPFRLVAGGVLGAGLVGLGLGLHRRETARTGALALVATGFAALYLTDAAATALYGYLPAPVALGLALVVAGAGLGVADRWRSRLLACGVTVAGGLLAPALADGWLLVALVLAVQVAALPVVVRRSWTVLLALAAAGPALSGSFIVLDETRLGVVVGLAATVLAAGLGSVLAARSTAGGVRAAVVVAASLPALAAPGALTRPGGALVVLGLAAVLGGLAFLPVVERPVRIAAGVTALVALLEATVNGLDGAWITVALLGQALVAAALAIGLRSRFAAVTGLGLGAIGLLTAIGQDAPLRALVRFGGLPYLLDGVPQIGGIVTGVAVSVLLLALATALLVATGRLGWTRPDAGTAVLWVPLGLTGLYGAASLVMALAMLVAPTQSGFTAGHAVITVSWTVAALVLLARGLRRPALRIAGLVLVAAALAKLVLFDLLALDGLARALAFLVAGLVLLAAGTRYARMVAEAERPETPAGAPAVPPNG